MAIHEMEVDFSTIDPPDIDRWPELNFSGMDMSLQLRYKSSIGYGVVFEIGLSYDPIAPIQNFYTRQSSDLFYHDAWDWGDAAKRFTIEHNPVAGGWLLGKIDGVEVHRLVLPGGSTQGTYAAWLNYRGINLEWFFSNPDRPRFDNFEYLEDAVIIFADDITATTWPSEWHPAGRGWSRTLAPGVATPSGLNWIIGRTRFQGADRWYEYTVGDDIPPPPGTSGGALQANMITREDNVRVMGYIPLDSGMFKVDVWDALGNRTTHELKSSGVDNAAVGTAIDSGGYIRCTAEEGAIEFSTYNPFDEDAWTQTI